MVRRGKKTPAVRARQPSGYRRSAGGLRLRSSAVSPYFIILADRLTPVFFMVRRGVYYKLAQSNWHSEGVFSARRVILVMRSAARGHKTTKEKHMKYLKSILQQIIALIADIIKRAFGKKDEPTTPTDEPDKPAEEPTDPTESQPDEPVEEIPVFSDFNIAVVADIHEDINSLNALLPKISGQELTLCLGDLIHRDSSNDNAVKKIKDISGAIKNYDGSAKIFCKGNHDNNTNNGAGYLTEAQISAEPLYGYKDFDEVGIRVIYVNTSDYDLFHGDTGEYADKYSYDLSWNNIPYITLKQLSAIAEYMRTTPKYYSVLLAGHYPTMGAGSFASALDAERYTDLYNDIRRLYGFSVKPLITLIRAFRNRTKTRITYADYRVKDSNYFWGFNSVDETTLCHLTNNAVANDSPAVHTDEAISEEDSLGYIDVDFTGNENNGFIAYLHGHTHNYTCCSAHKLESDDALIKDFLEIGFPAVNSVRNKGETNWGVFGGGYFGGEGCDDKYGIEDNKNLTAGGHASVVRISSANKTISVRDYSLNGNGFSRAGYWGDGIYLEKA